MRQPRTPQELEALSETIGGYSFTRWHNDEIQAALRHLGQRPRSKARKPELWLALHSAVQNARLQPSECNRLERTYRVHGRLARQGHVEARNARPETATAQQSLNGNTDPSGSTANNSTQQNFDCTICAETLGIDQRPERPEGSVCAHEYSICRQCLARSISAQLSHKSWDAVSCPSCNSRYGYNDIKAYADPVVFARYDTYLLQRSLSGAQFQLCRMDGCESGQMCFPEEDHYIICQDCHGRTCITCDVPWHPGLSCEQVAEQRAEAHGNEEQASDNYVAEKTKKCPKCNLPGDKMSGCDHMTCTCNLHPCSFFMALRLKLTTFGTAKHPGPQCGHQYCWVCLADHKTILTGGNDHHRETCMYHASNLPAHPLAAREGALVVGYNLPIHNRRRRHRTRRVREGPQ